MTIPASPVTNASTYSCRSPNTAPGLSHVPIAKAHLSAGASRSVRVAKSDDSRMEALSSDFSDPSALAGLENDPQAMARMMRKMGSEMGEEMPPEFGEVVDRLEKGQSPDEIEKELPDLGGAADGMMTDEG